MANILQVKEETPHDFLGIVRMEKNQDTAPTSNSKSSQLNPGGFPIYPAPHHTFPIINCSFLGNLNSTFIQPCKSPRPAISSFPSSPQRITNEQKSSKESSKITPEVAFSGQSEQFCCQILVPGLWGFTGT